MTKETIKNMVELLKENIECVHIYLDDKKIPRQNDNGIDYSIVGRIKRLEASFQKELSELESHYLTFKSNLSHRGYSLRDKELLLQLFSAGNECGCMEHENIEDYFEQYYYETFKKE